MDHHANARRIRHYGEFGTITLPASKNRHIPYDLILKGKKARARVFGGIIVGKKIIREIKMFYD
jgi:hypothetical protein